MSTFLRPSRRLPSGTTKRARQLVRGLDDFRDQLKLVNSCSGALHLAMILGGSLSTAKEVWRVEISNGIVDNGRNSSTHKNTVRERKDSRNCKTGYATNLLAEAKCIFVTTSSSLFLGRAFEEEETGSQQTFAIYRAPYRRGKNLYSDHYFAASSWRHKMFLFPDCT